MMAILIGSGALFLGALDFSINVNLPRFRSELGETLISVQLIIIMYHGARSGTGFVAGGIADRFGIKWPLVSGIVLYTLAVGLISLQDSLTPIVALRIPQGIGVAILFTLAPALVARAFGPSRRGAALGVTLGAMGLGTFAGTLGGGFLGQQIGWEAIFWARIPIGVALLIAAAVGLNGHLAKAVEGRANQRFDLPGSVTLFATLFTFILAMSFARVEGWLSPLPLVLFALTIVLGFIFAKGKRSGRFTIFPSGLTAYRGFKSGTASNLLLTVASFVMWFLFPFYVADVMGRSGLTLGALLALMAAMNFAGSGLTGWLADRVGDRPVTFAGTIITAIGLAMAGSSGSDPTMTTVVIATAVLGLGFGMHQAAVYALTLRGTPSEHAGATSAALTVSQTVGTVLSIALITTILNWQQSSYGSTFYEAYRFSYYIAAGIAAISGLVVLRMRRNQR
ncbi:MFS transporter [Candidatus Lucifugimonas marina]|uniref:MFS transporter n=2 Tax=Candidatus Lucifugimonas marina TaxID=3038979 RepID=A0AAJ6CQM7_9CHLR|nr:MFS transporter [SAR202 cluster bacterium JH702]MDG0869841.1 MFS transporter [SAR202 cluster bacterium JH639]WFG34568.1 MFS transporter [SAR202 cluster bacterium JH545]WFG38496.1 MFS transporter [SAR202 cluster bacterium JH1073]